VPIDFERQLLRGPLESVGYRANEPAFFSYLGVTQYLTLAATTQILQSIVSMAPGSEIVLEYLVVKDQLDAKERQCLEAMQPISDDGSQAWRTFFEPEQIVEMLHEFGFADVTDLDSEIINARYFACRKDDLRVSRAAHLVKAGVGSNHHNPAVQ
jgi:O-methyltransferase involved in polyketide biosynthesis